MTKLLIGMVIVTYFARFNKSGKTTLFPPLVFIIVRVIATHERKCALMNAVYGYRIVSNEK